MQRQETIAAIEGGIADLEKQLAELDRERAAVVSALEGLQEARSRLAALGAAAAPPPSPTEHVAAHTPNGQRRPVPPPGRSSLRPKHHLTIISILRDAGEPLSAPDIARGMKDRGQPGDVNSLRDIVHSVLRRRSDDLFRKVRRGDRTLWQLRSGANPENGEDGTSEGALPFAQPDLASKTITEAARIILSEGKNVPMHYREIAQQAKRRGYSGRSDRVSAQSFSIMMNRKNDVFESVGEGKFKLRESVGVGRA